jgi:soluble lytic murein transglycosylase
LILDLMRKIPIFVLTLTIATTITACNLSADALPTPNDENVIFVTATPELPTPNAAGEILITATPLPAEMSNAVTATPLATSQLPSTLAPTDAPVLQATTVPPLQDDVAQVMREADRLFLYGYYEDARAVYDQIAWQDASIVSDELRAEASYEAGRASLRAGLFDQAITYFSRVIQDFPQASVISRAYFLRGDAYLGLSQWQASLNDFQQYLNVASGLIDSYAYERIADAQLALGDTTSALGNYELAIQAGRTLVPELVLREKVAQIYINLGQVNQAVAQYDAILAVARNAGYRAQIDLYAAQALVNSGNTADGVPRARRIFDTYPQTASAYTALQILLNNGVALDGFSRGKVLYNYGDYNGAISAFNEYSSSYQLDAIPAELYLLLGRAYREIGNPQAAQIAFQTIIEQFPGDALFGDALLEQGRTHFLSGEIPTAIQTYLSIGDNYGYLSAAASDALWRAGYLYGVNGDAVSARQVFVRLAEAYPQSEWAVNGLFLAASTAVKNNEVAVAENLYGRIATLATGEDQAAAYYWVGRLASQRGDTNASSQAFALAQNASPDSYFAARARDLATAR